jgi:hypothetical protein
MTTVGISCPSCGAEYALPIQLTAECMRRAARQPVTPEMVHVCRQCGALLIVALHLAAEAIAS